MSYVDQLVHRIASINHEPRPPGSALTGTGFTIDDRNAMSDPMIVIVQLGTGGHQNRNRENQQWIMVWLRHKRWVELLWGAQSTATPSSMVESCRAVLWICIYVPMYATTMSCTKIREIQYSSSPFSWYLAMISCPCKIYTKPQWDQDGPS